MYIFKIIDKDTGRVMHEEEAKAIVYGYATDKDAFGGSCAKATAPEIAGAISAAREAGDELMSERPLVACFSGMIRDMKTAERDATSMGRECNPLSDLLQHFPFGEGEAK